MTSLSTRNQLILGVFLFLLLAVTRGHGALTLEIIPASTIGIFFLLGAYFRQVWVLTLAFIMVWTMDMTGMTWTADTEFCLKDSYFLLLLSYATYWAGGRLFAHWYAGETMKSLSLLVVIAPASAALGYLIASASFHYWSGLFETDLLAMMSDYLDHLPAHLTGLAVYLVLAVAVQLALTSKRSPVHHSRTV